MDSLLTLERTVQVLREFAVEVRNLYQDNLIRSSRIASGELLNSVECRVEADGAALEVKMTLADYWKYVEDDTKPHFPPLSAILRWVQIKPVLPRPDASGRIPRPEQLAYLIGRSIAEHGTKGSHDLERAKTETLDRFSSRLAEALGQDVEESFIRIVRSSG